MRPHAYGQRVTIATDDHMKNNDLVNVLEPLVNQISVSAMRFANGLVDEKGISPKEAAQTLLSDE